MSESFVRSASSSNSPRPEVAALLTVDISLPDVEELQKLVQEGQEKGLLTYDEIVAGLEDVVGVVVRACTRENT